MQTSLLPVCADRVGPDLSGKALAQAINPPKKTQKPRLLLKGGVCVYGIALHNLPKQGTR